MTHNYGLIGGKSPLLEISTQQGAALEKSLNGEATRTTKFTWECATGLPGLRILVREMIEDGIEQAVAFVLAPHYSSFSIAKYQQKDPHGPGNVRR